MYCSYLPLAAILYLCVFFFPTPIQETKSGCALKGRKVALNVLMEELGGKEKKETQQNMIFLKTIQICGSVECLF